VSSKNSREVEITPKERLPSRITKIVDSITTLLKSQKDDPKLEAMECAKLVAIETLAILECISVDEARARLYPGTS
jgi:hypothetical protein